MLSRCFFLRRYQSPFSVLLYFFAYVTYMCFDLHLKVFCQDHKADVISSLDLEGRDCQLGPMCYQEARDRIQPKMQAGFLPMQAPSSGGKGGAKSGRLSGGKQVRGRAREGVGRAAYAPPPCRRLHPLLLFLFSAGTMSLCVVMTILLSGRGCSSAVYGHDTLYFLDYL